MLKQSPTVPSGIVALDVERRIAVTHSGTVYALGEPSPDFVTYCEGQGIALTSYNKGTVPSP